MKSTKNPLPGMNPYLELAWTDAHTMLIGYIRDELTDQLPPDLRPRAEEAVAISAEEGRRYRADVAISESWKRGLPPQWTPSNVPDGVVVAEPEIISAEPMTERWVEIREVTGRLVTVIEVLSVTNKMGVGATAYHRKQESYVQAGVNLVEIDLVRGGEHVILASPAQLENRSCSRYLISVSRSRLPEQLEVYQCPLRERLPAIRIPLRCSDVDAILDLQPLIDRCYEKGRYWQTDYDEVLDPPLAPDDQAWLRGLVEATTSD